MPGKVWSLPVKSTPRAFHSVRSEHLDLIIWQGCPFSLPWYGNGTDCMFITVFPAGLNDTSDPWKPDIISKDLSYLKRQYNLSKEVSYMFGPLSLFWKLGIFFLDKASLYLVLGCHTGDCLVLFPHLKNKTIRLERGLGPLAILMSPNLLLLHEVSLPGLHRISRCD